MHVDDLIKELGEFGPYQKRRYFLMCIFILVYAWHDLNMVFIAVVPEFRCRTSGFNITGTQFENLSSKELVELFIPAASSCYQNDVMSLISEYHVMDRLNVNDVDTLLFNKSKTHIIPCQDGYEFSKSEYIETIVSEFQLVCENKFWVQTTKSVYFAGSMFGSVIFGHLSDRFGRKPAFLVGCLILLLSGAVVSKAPNIYVFLPMYFCQGAAHIGTFVIVYILSTELVGPSYRAQVGLLVTVSYSIGFMTLSGLAYCIRHWRHLMMVITFPVVFFSVYWWLLSESIHWLISHDKKEKAEQIINKVAIENKVINECSGLKCLKDDSNMLSTKHYNVIDCVRTWKMARLSINIWLNWLISAMVYYGISLNTENLSGNLYLNSCLVGAVEIPACIISILMLNRVGRRKLMIIFLLLTGAACIMTECVPTQYKNVKTSLALFGKFSITASYSLSYVIAVELFPTVVRNTGMGVAALFAGSGEVIAPIILELRAHLEALPLILFGSLSFVAGLLVLLLPETSGKPIPQYLDDVDS